MKKVTAVVLTVSLCLSCAVISVGAVPNFPVYRYGDVDHDQSISIDDVTAVQRYLAEMVSFDFETGLLADYNHDAIISVKDATEIQRAITELPQPEGYGGSLLFEYGSMNGYSD